MGFNRRKIEAERKAKADAEAAARRAANAQVLADAERLIAAWNDRQAKRMPLLFTPTIGAALASRQRAAPRATLTCAGRRTSIVWIGQALSRARLNEEFEAGGVRIGSAQFMLI